MIKMQKKLLSVMGWIMFGLVILTFAFAFGFVQGQKYARWKDEDTYLMPFQAPPALPAPCPFLPEKGKEYTFDGWADDDYMLILAGEARCSLKIVPESTLTNMLDDPLTWSELAWGDRVYFLSFVESGELVAHHVTVISPLSD